MHIDHDRQIGIDDDPYCALKLLQLTGLNDLYIRRREQQRWVNAETYVIKSQPVNKRGVRAGRVSGQMLLAITLCASSLSEPMAEIQAAPKRRTNRGVARWRLLRALTAIHLPRLLRPCGKRRAEQGSEAGYEGATVHSSDLRAGRMVGRMRYVSKSRRRRSSENEDEQTLPARSGFHFGAASVRVQSRHGLLLRLVFLKVRNGADA